MPAGKEKIKGGKEEGAGEEKRGSKAEVVIEGGSDDVGNPPTPPLDVHSGTQNNWGDNPDDATRQYKKRTTLFPPWGIHETGSCRSNKR